MTEIKNHQIFAITLLAITVAFAATPAHAQYSLLYNFGSQSTDPAVPEGSLTQGFDGALYGTSDQGGGAVGTVYKLTPSGKIQVLHSFCAQTNCADGAQPAGALTLRPDGHFLGATQIGGVLAGGASGFGTIFDISQTGSLTTLYTFTGGTDGRSPSPPIYTNGAYYGTANSGGGPSGCGTIYRIVGSTVNFMHHFHKTDGCYPTGLVLGTDGNLYGTTMNGGAFGGGVVFSMTPITGILTVLHSFDGDGSIPFGSLIQGNDGNFYGTTKTSTVGTLGSMIYKITPSGTYTIVYQLGGIDGTDGGFIEAGLVQATDGNFYGVASQGGACSECGTLFRVTPSGNFKVLHDFAIATGYNPIDAPTQQTLGVLYGVAPNGGSGTMQGCNQFNGCGILYSWNGSLQPFVSTVPFMGAVGHFVGILGQGFDSSTTVSFNGTPATATVVSGTYLKTTVPAGATTGSITVTTSGGTLTSNRQFVVTP